MSLEAMETLTAVEARLQKKRADAAAGAKQAAADAKTRGEALVAEARNRAQAEIAALTRQTDETAKTAAAVRAKESERECEALRAAAKAKEESAVSFVIERIVSS
ncbi:MAG: hypothetical protein LUG15_02085 [Oscillospiraceae bacterium]|nr:hypothetical protein [Oscillospiraceae bacterium]